MNNETAAHMRTADKQDRLLLQHLSQDARLSHRELARRTNMSLATINRRIRAMEASGTIRGYTIQVDPDAVGWGLSAVVGLRIHKGHLTSVQEAVAKDPRVTAVYDVAGEWDGFVLARVRDRADLDDFAKTTLSMKHIERTQTMIVLRTVAEGRSPPLA